MHPRSFASFLARQKGRAPRTNEKKEKKPKGLLPTPGPVTKRMGGDAWQELPIRRLTAGPTAKGYRGVSQGVSPWACFGYFPTRESNAPPARRNAAKPLGFNQACGGRRCRKYQPKNLTSCATKGFDRQGSETGSRKGKRPRLVVQDEAPAAGPVLKGRRYRIFTEYAAAGA